MRWSNILENEWSFRSKIKWPMYGEMKEQWSRKSSPLDFYISLIVSIFSWFNVNVKKFKTIPVVWQNCQFCVWILRSFIHSEITAFCTCVWYKGKKAWRFMKELDGKIWRGGEEGVKKLKEVCQVQDQLKS